MFQVEGCMDTGNRSSITLLQPLQNSHISRQTSGVAIAPLTDTKAGL